ncbi:MAG: hypothetical protein II839_07590 [Kiritimatiellae bacterium]|nr:hypothetical protein [Kiritimatiellia bacterium]
MHRLERVREPDLRDRLAALEGPVVRRLEDDAAVGRDVPQVQDALAGDIGVAVVARGLAEVPVVVGIPVDADLPVAVGDDVRTAGGDALGGERPGGGGGQGEREKREEGKEAVRLRRLEVRG